MYTYSHCHQMITQQQPKGSRGGEGHREIVIFQPTHNSLKTAKSILTQVVENFFFKLTP